MHFLVAFTLKIHLLLKFLLEPQIKLTSTSAAVCCRHTKLHVSSSEDESNRPADGAEAVRGAREVPQHVRPEGRPERRARRLRRRGPKPQHQRQQGPFIKDVRKIVGIFDPLHTAPEATVRLI